MDIESFTTKFAECFNDTDVAVINPATEFKKLDEWGSMMALIVIAMIDSEFNKPVTSDDLKNATTITSLYEIVKNR
jgi:acyl carrier protein